jgi:hypothetical protein
MADGIFFNWANRTYELKLMLFDEPTVWLGRIDDGHEVFFEAPQDCGFVDLMEFAIEAWIREVNGGA